MQKAWTRVLIGFLFVFSRAIGSADAAEKPLARSDSLPCPEFSVPSGVYSNSLAVRLSAKASGSVVRYTLDGSEPVETSGACAEPVKITNSTVIKARAFAAGCKPSPTVSRTYIMLDESLAGFNSNLPLVILHTSEGYISHDTASPVSARVINCSNGRAFLTGAAEFDGRGALKTRGRSSMEYPKRSFALHTKDDAGDSLKAPLLGMPKDSEWVLYAPYPDKTLMRDVLAYELSQKMGHYAPRTRFLELFVTRTGTKLSNRAYQGVYVLEEKIKRSEQRVPIQKLTPQDNAEPAITGGYIFKRDHLDKEQPRFSTARGNPFFYVEPKAEEITPTQKLWLTRYLNRFEDALYGPNFKDPRQGYAAYLDADSMIDQHWIVEMSKNVDGIRFSNFLYKDRGGKIKMEPIWDWNLSFGNARGRQGWRPEGWYWSQLDDSEYLWFGRLFEDADFAQRYVDRWSVLRTNVFSAAKILARVDEMASLLKEAQARNFQRWPILGRTVHPNWYVGRSYQDEVQWMKQWIQNRLAWIDQQFPSAPAFGINEGLVEAGASLAIDAGKGKVYYTLDHTDPRLSGGGISPAARLYKGPIILQENTHLFARARAGNSWSGPAVAAFTVRPNGPKH